MSDLRFTREIGSCCVQQKGREWRRREPQAPRPTSHPIVKPPEPHFPRAVSGTDELLWIGGKFYLPHYFKKFSNPRHEDPAPLFALHISSLAREKPEIFLLRLRQHFVLHYSLASAEPDQVSVKWERRSEMGVMFCWTRWLG